MRGARDGLTNRAARFAFTWLAACVFACGVARAQQQQPTATAGGETNAATAATTSAKAGQGASARTARQQPQPRPQQARPSAPVIAVLHKLRGWKLRALVTPPDAPFAATFDDTFVRTNIVAGYVMADGRSVVARLPRAEAEMLNFSTAFEGFELPKTPGDPSLLLVKPDGEQVAARFVGLDGSTGLSLLEAEGPLLGRVPEDAGRPPAVGQSVRVIAPLPAEATIEEHAPAVSPDSAVVGDVGVIHMQLGEARGLLKSVIRSPTGRAAAFTVQAERVSPEWAGGVALNDDGGLVGIVEQSGARETTLISAETVRAAARRVKARRASVPQPWLGARGDSVAGLSPVPLLSRGWPREQANALLRRQQGVVLTAVAPGTPAARAGLRPGDVVTRIENHEVRGVEDMTWILDEVGSNRAARFTVLRAQSAPLDMSVRLSEAHNPALETAHAEARAAQREYQSAAAERVKLSEEVRRMDERLRELNEALRQYETAMRGGVSGAQARYTDALEQLKTLQARHAEDEARMKTLTALYERAHAGFEEAATRMRAATAAPAALAARPLVRLGVEAVLITETTVVSGNAPRVRRGLQVVAVHAGGAAERAGLRVGDLIETVNGEPALGVVWLPRLPENLNDDVTFGVERDGQKLTLKLAPTSK